MKLIYVCSPLRGDVEGNVEKAKGYCKKVIEEGHIENTLCRYRLTKCTKGVKLITVNTRANRH